MDEWDESDAEPIQDLTPQTITALAGRLRGAADFSERIYREAELDALWSMVDMAVSDFEEAKRRRSPIVPLPELPGATEVGLRLLSDLVFRAHDLNAEGESSRAAELLMDAARLCASWS